MKKVVALALALLMLCGCAGSIFSHKPYRLSSGKVMYATPQRVVLEWPVERRWWCGPNNEDLCMGDFVHRVCAETVPAVGTVVNAVDLTWDKARKCWRWESQ